MIDPSKPTKLLISLKSKESKIQKIYRFTLGNFRGSNYEYQLVETIQDFVIKLAVFLKKKELRAKVLKVLFSQARLVLQLVLSIWNINLQYVVGGDPVRIPIIVIVSCISGTFGFICCWFSVLTILVIPPTLLTFLVIRNSVQQL